MPFNDDVALRRHRRRMLRDVHPRPAIYWCDLVASASLAWSTFVVTVLRPQLAWLTIPLSALATLRAAYFVHEIAHFRGALRGFEIAWNAIIGCWITMPSFMADPHVDHHHPATYGTVDDPEYEPVATWTRVQLVMSVASMVVIPPLLVLRFCVLGPMSWAFPPLRVLIWRRASALQTNLTYRRSPEGIRALRTVVLELATAVVITAIVVALATGMLPVRVVIVWWTITALALAINQARTLIAHGYVPLGRPRSLAEQVADSMTARGPSLLTDLVYPVGTRFHAAHHLAPTLPYHALARFDRSLRELDLPAVEVSAHRGLLDGWHRLWVRSTR